MTKPTLKRINNEKLNEVTKEEYGSGTGTSEIKDSEFNADRIDNLIPSARRTRIFDLLNLVDDLQTNSLDDVLEKAIDEGNKFLEWKKSKKDLENIQIFQKTGNEFKHISQHERLSASQSLEMTIKLKAQIDSQFEIWECDKSSSRLFPLYRIPFSKIAEGAELLINEPLRKDFLLNIEVKREEKFLFFKIAMDKLHQEQEVGSIERIRPIGIIPTLGAIYRLVADFVRQYVDAYQNIGQRWISNYAIGFATLCVCFFVVGLLLNGLSFRVANVADNSLSDVQEVWTANNPFSKNVDGFSVETAFYSLGETSSSHTHSTQAVSPSSTQPPKNNEKKKSAEPGKDSQPNPTNNSAVVFDPNNIYTVLQTAMKTNEILPVIKITQSFDSELQKRILEDGKIIRDCDRDSGCDKNASQFYLDYRRNGG